MSYSATGLRNRRRSFFSIVLGPAMLLVASASSAFAVTHIQSDWSGGPGTHGPVATWTDRFDNSSAASWRAVPGQVALASVPDTPTTAWIVDHELTCQDVAAGDLDGDGDIDLTSALALAAPYPSTEGDVRWYENLGDGTTWTTHVVDNDFLGGWGATTADIDGDGDLDIVAAAFYGDPQEDGRYAWYENIHGDATEWVKHFIAGNLYGTERAAAADIDGDGDLDVYGCSTLTYLGHFNDSIYWFENVDGQGDTWTQRPISVDTPDAIEAQAADIDGDGDLDVCDIAYGGSSEDGLTWWENVNGDGRVWAPHAISGPIENDTGMELADLDDDGDIDMLSVGVHSNVVLWYENLYGTGTGWAEHVVGPGAAKDVSVADLDGDGQLDVLTTFPDLYDSVVTWYRNLGGATGFSVVPVASGHDQGYQAIAADIDGDGALEVIYTERNDSAEDVCGLHRASITQFRSSGELVSSVLDAGAPVTWDAIDWEAKVSKGTDLSLQVRSSNDPLDLGPWSPELTDPGSLSGVLAPGTRYVQYRSLLSTTNVDVSPILRGVSLFESTPTVAVIGEQPASVMTLSLAPPRPNPSAGRSFEEFALPVSGLARIDIVDVTGRRVASPVAEVMSAGRHQVRLPELESGVYLVRLTAGGRSVARRLLVVR